MSKLIEVLRDPKWDSPFYKLLANNDTGAAPGHQGGIVIPKDLRHYFPSLDELDTDSIHPTTDRRITVELFHVTKYLATANTRFQLQTWGGTRAAESRLTDNLGPLRDRAKGGDICIFQRELEDFDRYRLILVKTSDSDFTELKKIATARWGVFAAMGQPVTSKDLLEADAQQEAVEQSAFALFDPLAKTIETTSQKVARSAVFREHVLRLYEHKCVFCGTGFKCAKNRYLVDAAHIVPRHLKGTNDARNGISLCKNHHWTFDRGLVVVSPERKLLVTKRAKDYLENSELLKLEGVKVAMSIDKALRASDEAFSWHFKTHWVV